MRTSNGVAGRSVPVASIFIEMRPFLTTCVALGFVVGCDAAGALVGDIGGDFDASSAIAIPATPSGNKRINADRPTDRATGIPGLLVMRDVSAPRVEA
jgi:hypothetical protein